MGDGIEKAVLLLISPNLADKEDCVDRKARDKQSKKNDAEDERDNLPPVVDDPGDIESDGQGDETNPSAMKNAMALVRRVMRMTP